MTMTVCPPPSLSLGVSLEECGDGLGQHYITPETAVGGNLTDIIIVGRAILNVSACHSILRHLGDFLTLVLLKTFFWWWSFELHTSTKKFDEEFFFSPIKISLIF